MASVYNSASGSSPFIGQWEDVQIYTSIITTIKAVSNLGLTVNIQWVNSVDDSPPDPRDRPLVTDSFITSGTDPITKEYSTRCRWVRVTVTGTGNFRLATTYKRAPTEIKLSDDTTNIVNVNLGDTHNSLYTVLSDASGATLRSTGLNQSGNSLYTHLADSSGNSLATTDTYRYIGSYDTSHYNFVGTDESNTLSNMNSNTIIFHEGTLRLATSSIGVKHGDIVQFLMLRSNDARTSGIGTQPLSNIFNNTYTVSGHIKVTGQVQYVSADPSFARIQILTEENTSNWFDPKVGLGDLTIKEYENMRNKHWVGVNHLTPGDTSIWYFKDSSAMDINAALGGRFLGGAQFPTPDDLYNIIADSSGLDLSAVGLSVASGTRYQYPLDPRLIRWSQSGANNLDNCGTAIMQVLTRANTKESLCVALRDSCNNSLASTGAGVTTYQKDNRSTFVPHVLYLVDRAGHYPAVTGTDADNVLRDLLSNFIRPLAADLPTTSRGVVILYDVSSSSQSVTPLVDELGIAVGDTDDLTDVTINTVASLPNVSMGDYWSALGAYVKLGGAHPRPEINTVIVISGHATAGMLDRDDQGFDACFNSYYGKMRRIAVSDYQSPDLLNFTGGEPGNFFQLKSGSTRGDFRRDISGYAQTIAKQLTQTAFVGHNALAVHTSDALGHSQAATGQVKEAAFGEVALYYSLADPCGSAISTYQTRQVDGCNNAVYVTLADGSGASISNNNGLYVTMDSQYVESFGFDTSLGGKLVTLSDISSINVDVSVTGFNMNNLSIANESAVPIWVKVYDICSGLVGTGVNALSVGPSAEGLLPYLKYNFAVPPTDYRDLQFSKPVLFSRGIYFAASTNFRYDSLDYPPGRAPIYINGNYARVTEE